MKIRTRVAPSPTGIPHIGTARASLFDYLLAKQAGGEFILRLEDTDRKRYQPESIPAIYEMHHFLGLIPDESPERGGDYGPYVQSERKDLYQKYAQELIDKGVAYEDEGAIRIKMPDEGYAVWKDMIQKKISFPYADVDDKVILKSDGLPTYHLAVVVDDHLMKITHVLRGVEWISSTPVHLFIYQSLGWEPPTLAHFPLILGPDKSKLSKRHGAKSVIEYKEEGYLPEALLNFLFYIGNSYQDNSAILSLDEMLNVFNPEKLQKQNAIYDTEKLNYFSRQWVKRLDENELLSRLKPFIPSTWEEEKLKKIIPLVKDRMVTLKDFESLAQFFFITPKQDKNLLLEQSDTNEAETKIYLEVVKEKLTDIKDWEVDRIDQVLHQNQKDSGWQPRQAFMTIRVAVSGLTATPPLFDTIAAIDKQTILDRIEEAIQIL